MFQIIRVLTLLPTQHTHMNVTVQVSVSKGHDSITAVRLSHPLPCTCRYRQDAELAVRRSDLAGGPKQARQGEPGTASATTRVGIWSRGRRGGVASLDAEGAPAAGRQRAAAWDACAQVGRRWGGLGHAARLGSEGAPAADGQRAAASQAGGLWGRAEHITEDPPF